MDVKTIRLHGGLSMKFKLEDFKEMSDNPFLKELAVRAANAKLQEWGILSENESCYPCHERCIHRIGSEE
jgi:hypothetical protein